MTGIGEWLVPSVAVTAANVTANRSDEMTTTATEENPRFVAHWERRYHEMCRDLAERAHKGYVHKITPLMYLYGFRCEGGLRYESVVLSRDRPKYSELVILHPVPRHMSVDQLRGWFFERLRREPVIQEDEGICTVLDHA